MRSSCSTPVRRRKVFYLPGYDPFPPRRYRELYRKQSAAQAAISGYAITMQSLPAGESFGWQVRADIDGQHVEADIEVLVWSDIVRDSRPDTIFFTYLDMFRTAWIYLASGALFRLMRLRKGPVLAALYPVVALMGQLAVAIALGGVAAWMVSAATAPVAGEGAGNIAAALVWLVAALALLRWFKAADGRFFAYYLMHDFGYSASRNGAYPPELEQRLALFRDKIGAALSGDADEVLVVGHSSGAYLGVSVLADLIRAGSLPATAPPLAFLSLGHVVPMVSFLPDADRLRGDLLYLSTRPEVTWVDVTAPGDGCCFALCDPVAVSGQSTQAKRGPLVFSAAFTQSLSPARWKALRWRFFRLHFQYLCAFDQPKDYDYFQITAGPLTLAQRYAGRAASKSRLDRTVSKYTSVRP